LKADDYLLVGYSSAQQPTTVNLFIAWYREQTDGSSMHSPEVCVPAGGWEMSKIKVETVTGDLTSGAKMLAPVNRAIIRKGSLIAAFRTRGSGLWSSGVTVLSEVGHIGSLQHGVRG
jgi:EpsI family protein